MSVDSDSLFAAPVLGYRCWNMDMEGRLYAIWKDELWTPGVNNAWCRRANSASKIAEHEPPGHDCGCGLYGYHHYARAQLVLEHKCNQGLGVLGAIAGRGAVEIHHAGWRAQEAQILGLLGPHTYSLEMVAERYQVPILSSVEELEAYATSLASPVPANHIPEPDAEELERQAQLREIHQQLNHVIELFDTLLRLTAQL